MVGISMLAMLWGGFSKASAQNLVVNLSDQTSVEVKLDDTFKMSFSEGNVIFNNEDGIVQFAESDITNVTCDYLFGDVNNDGRVDVADIATIINVMAGMKGSSAPAGAEAIDLDLPSHRMWANMNIGAYRIGDFGYYFAWGETLGYTEFVEDGRYFNWENYKFMTPGQSSWEYITKYQSNDNVAEAIWYDAEGRFIGDGEKQLLPSDDAARANWGKDWRMPTENDVRELIQYTQQDWVECNGTWGCRFTGKNGNWIFLPASGARQEQYTEYRDLVDNKELDPLGLGASFSSGLYWTSDLYVHKTLSAVSLAMSKIEGFGWEAVVSLNYPNRCLGLSVRAVLAEK